MKTGDLNHALQAERSDELVGNREEVAIVVEPHESVRVDQQSRLDLVERDRREGPELFGQCRPQ